MTPNATWLSCHLAQKHLPSTWRARGLPPSTSFDLGSPQSPSETRNGHVARPCGFGARGRGPLNFASGLVYRCCWHEEYARGAMASRGHDSRPAQGRTLRAQALSNTVSPVIFQKQVRGMSALQLPNFREDRVLSCSAWCLMKGQLLHARKTTAHGLAPTSWKAGYKHAGNLTSCQTMDCGSDHAQRSRRKCALPGLRISSNASILGSPEIQGRSTLGTCL